MSSSHTHQDAPATVAGSMELTVHPELHLVVLRFLAETSLTGMHGAALVDAMSRVVGTGDQPFALLADCKGARTTDSSYRTTTGDFFRLHRATARIALTNLGPLIRVIAEMFRVGIGLPLRTFSDEAGARSWLRTQGIDA